MESPKYSLNRDDGEKLLQVLGWSTASAAVAALLSLIPQIDVPTQYAILVPVVNTLLVAAKKFLDGQVKKAEPKKAGD